MHLVFKQALSSAVKWKLIPTNTAVAIDALKSYRTEMHAFDVEQAATFLAESIDAGLDRQTFFTVALMSVLRFGELTGLPWKDVDLT